MRSDDRRPPSSAPEQQVAGGCVTPTVSPAVSVVLCARNAGYILERQLAALRTQSFAGPWELLLVDNSSPDGTREVMHAAATERPRCRVLTESRVGLNHSRNRGIAETRADKIVLCDADDEVSTDWLAGMTDALDRFDVVGGALDVELLNPPVLLAREHNQTARLPNAFGRPYAVGANLAFRKVVWDGVGGFDGRFKLGGDDTDFCLRAQDAGYSIGFEPNAVVHYRLRVDARAVAKQHYNYGRGAERLIAKRTELGLLDGYPRTPWRWLAADAGGLLRTSPGMLAAREKRRVCLEAGAFLFGRVVERVHLSFAPTAHRHVDARPPGR